ncbi:MAG: hypothetical protein ACI9MB_000159 [Verrucomicrobiales bacterium]|jgi:hypothetical protein
MPSKPGFVKVVLAFLEGRQLEWYSVRTRCLLEGLKVDRALGFRSHKTAADLHIGEKREGGRCP